jgi:histone deacetylase 1/2
MKSEVNPSVYVAQVGDVKFFIMVYVDDFILVCNDRNKLLQIKKELRQKFEMKDLGELHFFLGMEVERNHDEQLLRINQIKYLKEECKPIGIPFNPKVKLQRNMDGNDESKGFPYQQVVGSLLYAMLCT